MQFLLTSHGEVRWLVALAAFAVLARSLFGWLRGASFGKGDRILMGIFTSLIALNFIFGVVLLLWMPGFPAYRLEHG